MLSSETRTLVENKQANIRILYEKHAGMLLGYISEIIKDRKLAEEYLVNIFYEISQGINDMSWDGSHSWCQLQRFAQKKLAHLTHSRKEELSPSALNHTDHHSLNKHFNHLNEDQKQIFYAVYYYGKPIEAISKELNKPEDSIRKTLKEAFAIMRKSCEN